MRIYLIRSSPSLLLLATKEVTFLADIGKQEIHKLPSESYDTQQNKQASSNQDTGIKIILHSSTCHE